MAVWNAIDYSNDAFRVYITWGGFLLVKILLMAFITIFHRLRTGAVENEEDTKMRSTNAIKKDETVERVRRAHLNDLENCIPFLIAALFYLMSEPDPEVASWLIRIAVLSRFSHTIVYAIFPLPQPARGICFMITLGITIFMIIWAMSAFFRF